MSPHWRVISTMTVIAVMSSVQVHSHPLGTKTFATQNSDDSEFRDKAYDEDFKKVTWVGDVPVSSGRVCLQNCDNTQTASSYKTGKVVRLHDSWCNNQPSQARPAACCNVAAVSALVEYMLLLRNVNVAGCTLEQCDLVERRVILFFQWITGVSFASQSKLLNGGASSSVINCLMSG